MARPAEVSSPPSPQSSALPSATSGGGRGQGGEGERGGCFTSRRRCRIDDYLRICLSPSSPYPPSYTNIFKYPWLGFQEVSSRELSVDERMIRRALALATLGTGTAAPNPRVGAVVARRARILGQGYHRRPGEPHAEAVALSHVETSGESASGATLYTTLEPCCHTGRTPPCVDRIVRAGLRRGVGPVKDP